MNKLNINKLSWFVTGLIDAKGSFNVDVRIKNSYGAVKFIVLVNFEVVLNKRDKNLLELANNVLGLENKLYYDESDDTLRLKVSSLDVFYTKIMPHLEKYPLYTQKRVDFNLMCKIVDLIKNKKPTTLEEIFSLKYAMNFSLTDDLKEKFPNIKPIDRELIDTGIPDFDWLSGFVEGEASFYVSVYKSARAKQKLAVKLVFKIRQHIRDENLLRNIVELLDCGRVEIKKSGKACDFVVTSFKEFNYFMIPFLINYPLKGDKLYDFKSFFEVYDMMLNKKHLSKEGLTRIIIIKSDMSTNKK